MSPPQATKIESQGEYREGGDFLQRALSAGYWELNLERRTFTKVKVKLRH
jgi:hypothetical protein